MKINLKICIDKMGMMDNMHRIANVDKVVVLSNN